MRSTPLLAVLLLAGCLGNKTERITVRRDPDELIRLRKVKALSYEEFLELRKNEEQQLEWDLGFADREGGAPADAGLWKSVPQYGIRESLAHAEETRERIRALVASVPEDPWRGFEVDRRGTLYRDWGDRYWNHAPVDKLEPEDDGPTGWIGPRKPPPLPAPSVPKKEEGAEEAPAEEGAGEKAEGEE